MIMGGLSVVISAYNEEKKIEDCLESVAFADEIVFVDSGSTDKTVDIASKYTSKIFKKPNNPMLNINKNFGFSKATGDWILSLDADERVTKELGHEIEQILQNSHSGKRSASRISKDDRRFWARRVPDGNPSSQNDGKNIDGYWIPRRNIIFGKWIQHTGWYPDHQLRLFKRGKGEFPKRHVHEMIKVGEDVGYLKNHIIHYNYDSIAQFLQKLGTIYAPNEAEQLIKKGYKFDWRDAIRSPVKEFMSRFFAREGYKDGFHGLMLSILMAFYHFIVFANIWERQGFKQFDREKILEETSSEFKKSYKDLLFWSSSEKIKTIKNPIKRPLYKLLNRFTKS